MIKNIKNYGQLTNEEPMVDQSKLAAPNRSVDEVMEQPEITAFIARYKIAIISIVVAAIATLSGIGIYSHFAEKNFQKSAYEIYLFNEDSLQKLTTGAITGEQFNQSFKQLAEKISYFKGVVPVAITASDYLLQKGDAPAVKSLLEPMVEHFGKGYAGHYLRSRLAVAYENLKEYPAALKEYEWLANSGINVLSAKYYTDLGRMYLLTGNKERAQSSFKYVVEKYKASEFYRVAQNYLMEMGAE